MKKILFVCVENSCRSQMAEAIARQIGGDRLEALSAGTRPNGRVHPIAIELMRELDYDLSQHISKPIEAIKTVTFDCIVTMGCGDACPILTTGWREDWNIPDPRDLSVAEMRHVRDLIAGKVRHLLRQLLPR